MTGDKMQTGDYVVKPTDKKAEEELIEFLKSNDFTYKSEFENNPLNNDYLIVINVIHRFYFTLDKFFITSQRPMNEGDFYRNINYFSDDVEYEEYFWNYAKKTSYYDKLLAMRDSYSQECKDRDQQGYENLCKLAEADAVDPKNYRNTMIKEHSIISGIMYNVMGFLHLRGRYTARKARNYDD